MFLHRLTSLFYCLIVYVDTSNVDHDTYLKQVHFHELGIQIQNMREKLYEQCPKHFQTPDSGSVPIIGRRQSQNIALDLKLELAENTLADLIQTLVNCTNTTRPQMTTPRHTETITSAYLTEDTTSPTSIPSSTTSVFTTTHLRKLN